MDLQVERQCVEVIKKGELRQFVLLFDAYFSDVYRYVLRRIGESTQAQEIVRLTFLDALGQARNTPADIAYIVWLYSLALPRVWDQMGKDSFPQKQGLIDAKDGEIGRGGENISEKAEKLFAKLSLEEREILRLKFFEQVSDGDVMMILGTDEGTIGAKIYRVLKRAHFLLFGESDEGTGVYFGELSGLLARIKEAETIQIPEAFRLTLKTDLGNRIERRAMAIETEEPQGAPTAPLTDLPFEEKPFKEEIPAGERKGSNDPAKIFVEAVKEMRQEEEQARIKKQLRMERQEKLMDSFDRWKHLILIVPAAIFALVVVIVVIGLINFGVERGYPSTCSIEVGFEGEFSDGERRSVNRGIIDRICGHFEVNSLRITKHQVGVMKVNADVMNWVLEYNFQQKLDNWRINEYKRTADSNNQSGKILRNSGGIERIAT